MIEGGTAACRADFDEVIARDFSDPLYFRTHRLYVDTYALQHPDDFCASPKSLAAHLAGLCAILEGGASMAVGSAKMQRWLNGAIALTKPVPPERRGQITIADLPRAGSPTSWEEALRAWAGSTWDAYSDLHPAARQWLRQSEGA